MDDLEDPRDVELLSLEAIYPELERVNDQDPYSISLEVPVKPTENIPVFFPAVTDAGPPTFATVAGAHVEEDTGGRPVESHELAYLPSLNLVITLGPQYPAEAPPSVTLSTNPPWIPAEKLRQLENDCTQLWEDMGRDIVVFTYVDHLQQLCENVFGLVGEKGGLEVDASHMIAVLDYDIEARRKAFEKETFDCGVCLDPKKGSVCHRMMDCGHVFCIECLQDFYNNAIKEGDLASVRCLAPNCAKEREKAAEAASGKKKRRPRVLQVSPSELLQIPLAPDVVKRFVSLKYKTQLESDKNTIYCPRSWCKGAARSKRHRKPEGLELSEQASDDESDAGDDSTAQGGEPGAASTSFKPFQPSQDLLAICEDCAFAFCSRCLQSWHGEFYRCRPFHSRDELSEEEKASLEYLKLHTTPCPTCAAPAQKTHGCNHMVCYRCQTHFCYLCSTWLIPDNPYQHFNEAPGGVRTACFQRLWELEEGDGDEDFVAGGRRGQQQAVRALALNQGLPPAAPEELHDVPAPGVGRQDNQQPLPAAPAPGPIAVAREGPLVLRIEGGAPAGRGGPRGRGPAPPHPQPADAGPPPGAGRRGRGRNRGRGAAARGRGQVDRRQGPVELGFPEEVGFDEDEMGVDLTEAQAAWIRRFVRLALEDEEDQLIDLEDVPAAFMFRDA